MKKTRNKKAENLCDPAVCDDCVYLGDGDFICWKQDEIVVTDWEPTKYYMMCETRHQNRRRRKHDTYK